MTTEPKPFALPPMPEPWAPQETSCFDDRKKWIDHAFQLAEIAQAQARRAENLAGAIQQHVKMETAWKAERDALKARVAELDSKLNVLKSAYDSMTTHAGDGWSRATTAESTLAQRDREVLALREGIQKHKDRYIFTNPDHEDYELWKILESTAQVGEEAERRVRQDERDRIAALISDHHNRIVWRVPGSGAIHADPRLIRAALEPNP